MAAGCHTTQPTNPNLQLPYYQTTAYGPALLAGGIPYGAWSDTRLPAMIADSFTLNTDRAASGEMMNNMRDQIAHMLREIGFTPRGRAKVYHKPYPEYFDTVPYPRGFRIPNFAEFTEED
jgi:hypothetical protein